MTKQRWTRKDKMDVCSSALISISGNYIGAACLAKDKIYGAKKSFNAANDSFNTVKKICNGLWPDLDRIFENITVSRELTKDVLVEQGFL